MADTLTSVSTDHSPLTGSPDITKSAQTAVGDIVTKAKDKATRLAKAAADEIDTTAQYVREHDSQQMFDDLKRFVTRHPVASLVGAAVMGVLVGRGFRNR
jgi:ElaB/YqjD/DUF883 family membrane-anchored ribosome-binding protein